MKPSLKAHLNFSSGDPLEVMSVANMNSLNRKHLVHTLSSEAANYSHLKVNGSVTIFIKNPEYLLNKVLGVSLG